MLPNKSVRVSLYLQFVHFWWLNKLQYAKLSVDHSPAYLTLFILCALTQGSPNDEQTSPDQTPMLAHTTTASSLVTDPKTPPLSERFNTLPPRLRIQAFCMQRTTLKCHCLACHRLAIRVSVLEVCLDEQPHAPCLFLVPVVLRDITRKQVW